MGHFHSSCQPYMCVHVHDELWSLCTSHSTPTRVHVYLLLSVGILPYVIMGLYKAPSVLHKVYNAMSLAPNGRHLHST